MPYTNLINGQKPEIGNPDHIAWYKRQCDIMSGEMFVSEFDWEICQYIGNKGETNKPIHKYVDEYDCDALLTYLNCPKCRRLHKLLIHGYDPHLVYQSMLEIEKHLEEEGFECWNCGLEFEYDMGLRQIFVKQ